MAIAIPLTMLIGVVLAYMGILSFGTAKSRKTQSCSSGFSEV
jgi:hypothetical protein